MRILYVEDHAGVREMVHGLLEDAGYDVVSAEDAETGLAALCAEPFDLLLTDYRLPGRNADWLVAEVERRRALAPGRTVILTGEQAPSGVEGLPVVKKPIDLPVLLAALEERFTAPGADRRSA